MRDNFTLTVTSVLLAFFLAVPTALRAADDTFACLQQRATITLSKNFGYGQYKNRTFPADTIIDARRARWQHEQVPNRRNLYPINLGGGRNACWAGGAVTGTSDLNASWSKLYDGGRNNSASIIWFSSSLTIDGLRIHNTWDSLRPASGAADFMVRNVWVSRNRDDCLENDGGNSGLLADSLIDGCYAFYSETGSRNGTVTMENNLVRLEPLPGAHNDGPDPQQPGHKGWFKGTVTVKLYNNVFMQEQKGNIATRSGGMPKLSKSGTPTDTIVDCADNIMVWTGPGEYPYYLDPGCFTVTKDLGIWDRARQNWIDCHPNVSRRANDPVSNPSRCDPNWYGGS